MSNDDFNPDRDWGFDVNLSDVQAPTQLGNVTVPEGYYRASITDMYKAQNKPNRVVIKLKMLDDFAGVTRTDGMNRPKNSEDNVRYYWRALAESAGYTPAQLDKGEINLGPKAFIGKTVHFHFKPKAGEGTYENISYFAESVWNQHKASFTPKAVSGSAMGGSPSSSVLGGDTTSPADVLKTLGVSL
jgi:hypothetical protein